MILNTDIIKNGPDEDFCRYGLGFCIVKGHKVISYVRVVDNVQRWKQILISALARILGFV